MIGIEHIGLTFGPFSVEVERGPLRLFAKATGQTDAVYAAEDSATDADHPNLPIPPTYLMCLSDLRQDLWPTYQLLDPGDPTPMHAEQEFEYHRQLCSGEVVTVVHRLVDVYERKQGALRFVVIETEFHTSQGELAALGRSTEVFRTAPEEVSA